MKNQHTVSNITKHNWFVNVLLMLSAITASLSGIYFLFFARGGGRNPNYAIHILFSRHGWEDIHLWAGVLMIIFVTLHIPFHWKWIVATTKRLGNILFGRCNCMNTYGKLNALIDVLNGLSFIGVAVSGLYFLSDGVRPELIFTRTVWDLIHIWSGVVFIASATAHLMIHWKWIVKVAQKMFRLTETQPNLPTTEASSAS